MWSQAKSLRVFCVGWIEKPGGLQKVSQPWWVVTSNAQGAGHWGQRGSAWILTLFFPTHCAFHSKMPSEIVGGKTSSLRLLEASLQLVWAEICSAVTSGLFSCRPTQVPQPQPELRLMGNVLQVPPALQLWCCWSDRVGGYLHGWVWKTTGQVSLPWHHASLSGTEASWSLGISYSNENNIYRDLCILRF